MRYLFLLFFCLSCGDDKFPKVEKLESFRILGANATAPEVAPGGSSDIQLIVSDVNGTSPVIEGTYVTCVDPGISRGAPVACPVSLQSGDYDLDFGSLLPNSTLRTGVNLATLTINVPATILNGRSTREQSNGVGVIAIFTFTVNGKVHTAFKRIIATNRALRNTNPVITDILANGTSMTSTPADGSDLILTTSTPPEQYDLINVDNTPETKLEDYEVAWYSNVAEFSKPKARFDDSSEIEIKSSGPSVYLGILRDERGGMAFEKVTFP